MPICRHVELTLLKIVWNGLSTSISEETLYLYVVTFGNDQLAKNGTETFQIDT